MAWRWRNPRGRWRERLARRSRGSLGGDAMLRAEHDVRTLLPAKRGGARGNPPAIGPVLGPWTTGMMRMGINKIEVISIPVSNQQRAKEFYVGTLGFDLIVEAPMGDGND